MELILQRDDLQDTFESKWDSCVDTILKYAVSHKSPSKDLRLALRQYPVNDDGNGDVGTLNTVCMVHIDPLYQLRVLMFNWFGRCSVRGLVSPDSVTCWHYNQCS